MSSTDWVSAQARLLSDSKLRKVFREAPEKVAKQLGISKEEQAQFVRLDPDQLDAQAETLISKRLSEIRSFLPLTFWNLGEDGNKIFRSYADSFWPEGHDRHLLDALHFAEFIRSERRIELCMLELNCLKFIVAHGNLRLHFTVLRISGQPAKPGLQILFFWNSEVRCRFLYFKFPSRRRTSRKLSFQS